MRRIIPTALLVSAGLVLLTTLGKIGAAHPRELESIVHPGATPLPILLEHKGRLAELERPPVAFDHDRHTAALKQAGTGDCSVCHQLKETDPHLSNGEVQVFRFPKVPLDMTDKGSLMHAYHDACVGCHRKMTTEGKATGPLMGLCGKCHVKRAESPRVTWAWSPVFNYARHAGHVQASERFDHADNLNIAGKIEIAGTITRTEEKCLLCHHTYDKEQKKLIYKENTENSCGACHKAADEENARSMKKVAHAACIGCHMKLADKVWKELAQERRPEFSDQDQKKFGPLECKGCHGEHKELSPEEIAKLPRLVRGQNDVMDLPLESTSGTRSAVIQKIAHNGTLTARMKAVPYNHKAHEPRVQFCDTCHHHSLERCSNCHSLTGDSKKGGSVSYQEAFHRREARQACVGCHAAVKETTKCQGCHEWLYNGMPNSSCPVCHRGPSDGKPIDIPAMPLAWDKDKVPDKLQIKVLEKEFKPAEFPHLKVVSKLATISNESSLARWFHEAKPQWLCAGCHHRSELQQAAVNVPNCSTCHNRPFQPSELGKPGLLGAYHRQCMGCHEAMKQKPAPLECVKCHPAKQEVKATEAAISRLGKKD